MSDAQKTIAVVAAGVLCLWLCSRSHAYDGVVAPADAGSYAGTYLPTGGTEGGQPVYSVGSYWLRYASADGYYFLGSTGSGACSVYGARQGSDPLGVWAATPGGSYSGVWLTISVSGSLGTFTAYVPESGVTNGTNYWTEPRVVLVTNHLTVITQQLYQIVMGLGGMMSSPGDLSWTDEVATNGNWNSEMLLKWSRAGNQRTQSQPHHPTDFLDTLHFCTHPLSHFAC